jgi:CspA family cold shock protein
MRSLRPYYFIKIIMNKGTVKFFNESKGFGFITDVESKNEYFVHVSGLNDQVRENDEVTFDLQEGRKGLNAVNVKLA